MTRTTWRGWLSQQKFLLLLVSLLSMAVLHPLLQGPFVGEKTYDVLFCLFLMAAIFAVSQHRQPLLVALLLGIPALVATWAAEWAAGYAPQLHPQIVLARCVAYLVFLGFTVVIVLQHVLQDEKVTNEKLYAAVCVYLLLGVLWSTVYAILEYWEPGSFALADVSDMPAGRAVPHPGQLTYYSFVTLTTLGYGDVTPVTPAACTLSWLEALLGQMYLAVLIARLVGLHIAHTAPQRRS